ncbi:MAG: MotA/TolQ/ExbB proton channel family protein, partial [Myxococcota bacterium]
QEMTESGKVVRYKATVSDTSGERVEKDVVRVGPFNAVSEGTYLRYDTEISLLASLPRQPPARYRATVEELEASNSGFVRFAVDPSRGAILGLLIEAPSPQERIALGGTIGYIVIGLGIFALLVGIIRLIALGIANMKISSQLRSKQARGDNAIGRMLQVYESNKKIPAEDLERKLDEVIVRESASFDRFLWIVKVVAVAAPLMGLLGTVTGMIRTFQAITLFGTGDPKLMAGGISEALVTTMLGLVVAIPLVLFHAVLANMSKRMLDIVEEQAAGVVARRAEDEHNNG